MVMMVMRIHSGGVGGEGMRMDEEMRGMNVISIRINHDTPALSLLNGLCGYHSRPRNDSLTSSQSTLPTKARRCRS